MTQEIDLESALRPYSYADVTIRINEEGRLVLKFGSANDIPEYIVFGNNVCQYPPPKPPTQRAQVQGIDAFKGMGAR